MRKLAEIKKFKIDNHNITTARCIFENIDVIIIYYDYNNNYDSATIYYDLKEHKFLYDFLNLLTKRQKTILEKKVLKLYRLKTN